jgi:hypothetical protein
MDVSSVSYQKLIIEPLHDQNGPNSTTQTRTKATINCQCIIYTFSSIQTGVVYVMVCYISWNAVIRTDSELVQMLPPLRLPVHVQAFSHPSRLGLSNRPILGLHLFNLFIGPRNYLLNSSSLYCVLRLKKTPPLHCDVLRSVEDGDVPSSALR